MWDSATLNPKLPRTKPLSRKLDGCPMFAHLPRLAVGAYMGRKDGGEVPTTAFPLFGSISSKAGCPICPDFLRRLVALIHSMRLSLVKGAHADLSSTAWQETGVKPFFGLSGIPLHSPAFFVIRSSQPAGDRLRKKSHCKNRHGCEARRAGRQNFSPAREGWESIRSI
jgi:hypothetical protein